jgi:hypothetical protein
LIDDLTIRTSSLDAGIPGFQQCGVYAAWLARRPSATADHVCSFQIAPPFPKAAKSHLPPF